MTFIPKIKLLLQSNNLWDDSLTICPNPNRRGQSFSYFICDSTGTRIYIAKFFDYLKNISIPASVDISSCQTPEEVIELLADAVDFTDDVDAASNDLYYKKRTFKRYVQVCLAEDSGFPQIIAFEENSIINSRFYGLLIEEAIVGITLEEHLTTGTIPDRVSFAIDFLDQMTEIIKKFISHGIVHRDLSPDNIMIRNGKFIVIDPGVVKIVNRNTTEVGYSLGKRTYMSPEQYYGFAVTSDFTSDLYAIGIILFEIVAGINPLEQFISIGASSSNSPHLDLINNIDRDLEDQFFDNIDETQQANRLYIIIRKLLQPNKTHRFDNIDTLKESIKILKEDK